MDWVVYVYIYTSIMPLIVQGNARLKKGPLLACLTLYEIHVDNINPIYRPNEEQQREQMDSFYILMFCLSFTKEIISPSEDHSRRGQSV